MRTLDEVIKALTICKNEDINRTCEGCPIPDTEMCINELMTDALQWLKGYKAHIELDKLRDKYGVTSQKLRNTSQITCPKCHSEFVILPESNNALTWDELKAMEGKPVWIEERSCRLWIIARNFQRVQYENIDTEWLRTDIREIYYDKADIGKTWKAYRKERS